eukprot:scaffold582769_cov20-Prasinocladus_malaysianus.AAC.1
MHLHKVRAPSILVHHYNSFCLMMMQRCAYDQVIKLGMKGFSAETLGVFFSFSMTWIDFLNCWRAADFVIDNKDLTRSLSIKLDDPISQTLVSLLRSAACIKCHGHGEHCRRIM